MTVDSPVLRAACSLPQPTSSGVLSKEAAQRVNKEVGQVPIKLYLYNKSWNGRKAFPEGTRHASIYLGRGRATS